MNTMISGKGRPNIVVSHVDECPFVDRTFIPIETFNTPVDYKNDKGIYRFYDHDDGFGNISRVQFCRLIGRKRDVFECLNTNEWHACAHYHSHKDEEQTKELQKEKENNYD